MFTQSGGAPKVSEASPTAATHGAYREEWLHKLDKAYEYSRHAVAGRNAYYANSVSPLEDNSAFRS